MAGYPDDGFDYEWEAVRQISPDLKLECNFHLDAFPAILTSKSFGRILISGPELVKLMTELADRFNMRLVSQKRSKLPNGLCSLKEDHKPHEVHSNTLGWYWCTADQKQREPFRSEQKRRNETT